MVPGMLTMNIVIADDHPLYREALASILDDLGPNIVIFQAGSFDEVVELVSDRGVELDLILLDLYMGPGDWGLVIKKLRHLRPGTPIIVISGSDSLKDAERAIRSGSYGFIPKSMKKDEMLSAIKLVLTGGVCVQPRDLESAIDQPDAAEEGHPIGGRLELLTSRQLDVLAELSSGKSNKLIARSLGMTEGTVKLHVAAIMKNFGMSNRTQVAILANQLGVTQSAT